MATLKLEIPEDVVRALKLPPEQVEAELRKLLALALYERNLLSLGKARILAQMSRREFMELLGQHHVPRHYTQQDLEDDLRYAEGQQGETEGD